MVRGRSAPLEKVMPDLDEAQAVERDGDVGRVLLDVATDQTDVRVAEQVVHEARRVFAGLRAVGVVVDRLALVQAPDPVPGTGRNLEAVAGAARKTDFLLTLEVDGVPAAVHYHLDRELAICPGTAQLRGRPVEVNRDCADVAADHGAAVRPAAPRHRDLPWPLDDYLLLKPLGVSQGYPAKRPERSETEVGPHRLRADGHLDWQCPNSFLGDLNRP